MKAQLPAVKVYATKEKISDALRVVNALAKSGSTPQPAPQVRGLTTGQPTNLEDEPPQPQAGSSQMEMEFHLGSFVATIRQTEAGAGAHGKPLLRARMEVRRSPYSLLLLNLFSASM